ncbi:MAG: ArnT family glycosyltransferase [Bdellovibrio sp.]
MKIWIDAIIFKIFGASAQTIRLTSSIAGLVCIAAVFQIAKKILDEQVAAWATFSLFTITIFFNFSASGWLDIPMVTFIMCGYYLIVCGERSSKTSWYLFGAGLLFSCAILTKGLAAIGVIPLVGYCVIKNYKRFSSSVALIGGLLIPVALFTYAHYQSEHFIFWTKYLSRQVGIDGANQQLNKSKEFGWYILSLFEMSHIIFLLLPLGVAKIYRRSKSLAFLICAEILIHILIYSFSSRHYRQYTLSVYPWLVIAAGAALADLFSRVTSLQITKGLAALGLFYFIAIDLLPIRVHAGSENSYRALAPAIETLKDDRNVYFPGEYSFQDYWEIFGSYIAWYFDRTPQLISSNVFLQTLAQNPKSLGLVYQSEIKKYDLKAAGLEVCTWNEELAIIATPEICPPTVRNYRPEEPARQTFTR